MKKYFIYFICLVVTNGLKAQKVGIGTTSPVATLHIVTSNQQPLIVDGGAFMYITWAENGINRGYLGSYAGNAEDVDFGTYVGNNTGKLHFTIQDVPKMTIASNGYVGIGTTTPGALLDVTGNGLFTGQFVNTNSTSTGYGVYGACLTAPTGFGVCGYGSHTGVDGRAEEVGVGLRYGVLGQASGGSIANYGVLGYAYGGAPGTLNYGVYGGTNTDPGVNWAGYFSGAVFANTYSSSDRKLKNDIKTLTGAISIITQLNPYFYTYKTTEYKQMHLPEGIHYGLIADEVQQVLPGTVKKAVQPAEYENHDEHNGKKLSDQVEFSAINYTEMIPILIGAIKEQQVVIEKQQQQINELLKEIELIKKK